MDYLTDLKKDFFKDLSACIKNRLKKKKKFLNLTNSLITKTN